MKNILVTGGAGYIGSHTVMALLEQGYNTITFDNLSEGHRESVTGGEFFKGDLSDPEALREVFSTHSIDGVVHFASKCYVGESMENPQKYYYENVVNGLNLLKIMMEYGVKNIIFSSSAATYGNPHHIPITEEHPASPINTYGETKLIIEKILRDYDRAYGLKYISLRYFNAAGADPKGRIGENHEPETHLIPLVLDAAMGIRENIQIFGTDYDTEDGTCVRDYIHILDLAEAHILGLKKLFSGGKSGVYNLGTGNGNSVREIIEVAERVTGKKIPVKETPRRPGDPPALIASSKKAKKELGWKPAYEDINLIIETAWKWHKKLKG